MTWQRNHASELSHADASFNGLKLLVVAHDAGGAEILSALLVQHPHWQVEVVLGGPAEAIFKRKLGAVPPQSSSQLETAVARADWVLTGSGWQSMLEWDAIRLARETGKPVATFLDHWVNYRERFIRQGKECLPDQIWVGDVHARDLARRLFPQVTIALHENPYFQELRADWAHMPPRAEQGGKNLLFIGEPIAAHAKAQYGDEKHWGYTEMDALQYFLQQVPRLWKEPCRITIRPHPSEGSDKYQALLAHSGLPIEIGTAPGLKDEIAAADAVFGCNSMALVMANLAGKPVYCCIPPGGPHCNLPLEGIKMLRDIVQNR